VTTDPISLPDLLGLPEGRARETHRLTKKDIAAAWEDAPVDARLLTKTIAQATIVGVLSPATIGVRSFVDVDHRVDMIPTVEVRLAEKVKQSDRTRVAELLHRSMPRPAVLSLVAPDGGTHLSLALTRLSRTEDGRSVIEAMITVPAETFAPGALRVTRLAQTDLAALHRDLVRTVAADGAPASAALTAADAVSLRQRLTALEGEVAIAARDAGREKNMQRRIDLNARAKSLRTEIDSVRRSLYAASTPKQEAQQ
jgi:hypothetical protein